MKYRFLRSSCPLPPAQLNHIDCSLSFFEDRVEGAETLTLTAREPLSAINLDAKDLEIGEVSIPGAGTAAFTYDRARNRLTVPLPAPVKPGDTFRVAVRCTCHPSDTLFDGIYRDVTPPGNHPQQYMSQCEQWGFERILPVIDDCTAKCTFRTTLEGDSRYTHLISNGDVDRASNPSGKPEPKPGDPSRRVITYVNPVPMAPYLFIACAGTWDELDDEVTYPEGKRIRLEYLVPPGRLAGAKVPMQIIKRSVLWQHQTVGFTYPYETYRTITMEKSNYGGMENVGNTTIITEAALIDDSMGDSRLIYAYGVIPHEYEHNHCGSGVTMATPFDMWLNEAYTVNVEQDFVATVFHPVFLRLRDVDALRAPGGGPLAMEDTGKFGQIVREGFNDPDEVVDGVTYDKAPEVLRMLSALIGPELYRKGTDLYFRRYDGGNATTEQFLGCIAEVAGGRLDVKHFADVWLFHAGYPRVTASYSWDAASRAFRLHLAQRPNVPSAHAPFPIPFLFAAVDTEGKDIFEKTVAFDHAEADFTVPCPVKPAFVSLNRNAAFYGSCEDASATPEDLALQARLDPHTFNRVEAMRRLTDLERKRFIHSSAAFSAAPLWLRTFQKIFDDTSIPDGVKGYLLSVDEQPLDRSLLPFVRENPVFRRTLRRAAAKAAGFSALSAALRHAAVSPAQDIDSDATLSAAIEHRFLQRVLLQLLSAMDTRPAWSAMEKHLAQAVNITDRLNTLAAIWQSSDSRAAALLTEAREKFSGSLGGYLGYLQIIGTSPRPNIFCRRGPRGIRPGIFRRASRHLPLALLFLGTEQRANLDTGRPCLAGGDLHKTCPCQRIHNAPAPRPLSEFCRFRPRPA